MKKRTIKSLFSILSIVTEQQSYLYFCQSIPHCCQMVHFLCNRSFCSSICMGTLINRPAVVGFHVPYLNNRWANLVSLFP